MDCPRYRNAVHRTACAVPLLIQLPPGLEVWGVSSQIRWLTHTGREVSPSGLKPISRKRPPLARRVELLGTIALHWTPLGLMCCIKRLSVFRWLTHQWQRSAARRAKTEKPDLYGRSTTGLDLYGRSTTGLDLYGRSTTGPDLYGRSTTGLDLYGRSTTGPDLYGRSTTGPDLYGRSTTGLDLYGRSTTGLDLYGRSTTGPDLYGRSTTGPDLYGRSTTCGSKPGGLV
jgi:hypothetical protein